MNANVTIVMNDRHDHDKGQISVILSKHYNEELAILDYFLLTVKVREYNEDKEAITDEVIRNPREALVKAINTWNKVVMENPVSEKADDDDFPF